MGALDRREALQLCGLAAGLAAVPWTGATVAARAEDKDKYKVDKTFLPRRLKADVRKDLLDKGGGTAATEEAVARGLEWLALHQAPAGNWSLDEFHKTGRDAPLPGGKVIVCSCQEGTARKNDLAATALALLPLLTAGHTHQASRAKPDYSKAVAAGLTYLLSKQDRDGRFGGDHYTHALAMMAVCEVYGMSGAALFKAPAQKAVAYLLNAQDPTGGGWRYTSRQPGDLSVTGWVLQALYAAQAAGLAVPPAALDAASKFVLSCETKEKGHFLYVPTAAGESLSTPAIGLLCRLQFGAKLDSEGVVAGVELLKKTPPGKSGDRYYEYYATRALFNVGGDAWKWWNEGPEGKDGLRDTLVKAMDDGTARGKSHQAGSWEPATGLSRDGGRLLATALALLTLQVSYRYPRFHGEDKARDK
jgi:hypothetical protein